VTNYETWNVSTQLKVRLMCYSLLMKCCSTLVDVVDTANVMPELVESSLLWCVI
jgi:hypothetical protein